MEAIHLGSLLKKIMGVTLGVRIDETSNLERFIKLKFFDIAKEMCLVTE